MADLSSLSRRRLWAFRLFAVGMPPLVGGVILVAILISQERLVFDPQTGHIAWATPLPYVEEPGSNVTGHRYLHDPLLGWRNIPGWKATTRGQKLTINSKGLRGPERDYDKPPGVSRMLVLGDSFAWGYGVADDEVFAAVLEGELRQQGRSWEILNGGVSGWGTDQEYLFLVHEGFKYAPDLVVLAFLVFNDPENNSSTMQYGLYKPAFNDTKLDLVGVPVPMPGGDVGVLTSAEDPLDLTVAIVRAMAEACQQRGSRLVLMKFGMFLRPENPRAARWDGAIKAAFAEDSGLVYLDVDEEFTSRGLSREFLSGGNHHGHWNAEGHRVAAEILLAFLEVSGMVN